MALNDILYELGTASLYFARNLDVGFKLLFVLSIVNVLLQRYCYFSIRIIVRHRCIVHVIDGCQVIIICLIYKIKESLETRSKKESTWENETTLVSYRSVFLLYKEISVCYYVETTWNNLYIFYNIDI